MENADAELSNEKNIQKNIKASETHSQVEKNSLPFMVVGVGASAGGLEALERLFSNMPSDTGLAFVVVQHLSPDYKSMMVELIRRYTTMKVINIKDNQPVEPNSIYLIPPKTNLTIFHGNLYLTEQGHHRALNLPINIFLRSLAEDQGKNAIGIILSGTGSDGTTGVKAIKEVGGMVMVQDEKSSKFDGMPKSAVATGLVDYILPPDKMPEVLIKYIKHPYVSKSETIGSLNMLSESLIAKILVIIKNQTGMDFSFYKPNTIIRRLERRISINQINKINNYISLLNDSTKEVNILYKELLIGVTQFYRDTTAYNEIEQNIIPKIFEKKDKRTPVRLWSVGCSTGEEAYSLAILIKEYMLRHDLENEVKIFATDLDRDAVEYAGIGIYLESIATDVSKERLASFFISKKGGFQVNEEIRQMVVFAKHNIITDPPFSKIDLIICRNLLIYLKSEVQKKILSLFHFALNPGCFLFLGSSETTGELSEAFTTLYSKWKIYQRKRNFRVQGAKDFILPQLQRSFKSIENDDLIRNENNLVTKESSKGDNEAFYEALLNVLMPPTAILDKNFNVLQIFQDLNPFIKVPAGKLSWNFLKIIRPDLSVLMSTILHRVKKDKKDLKYHKVPLKDEKQKGAHVDITARSFTDPRSKDLFILVSFNLIKPGTDQKMAKDEETGIESQYDKRIEELEKELQYSQENLQSTIEELETSNEELQATNQELIASNEELQSTNEELQSVNEELYTVNSEYQNKIEELTKLNNDINNLLENTNIGTLFLDSKLRIRKFTPKITKVINILDMDIGRPIAHISHNTLYQDLISDVESVIDTLKPKEIEVTDKEGIIYLMRIMPYRTQENAVDGIIITLVDITKLKKYEKELEDYKKNLEQKVEEKTNELTKINRAFINAQKIAKIANWQYNLDENKVDVSGNFFEILGISQDKLGDDLESFLLLVHNEDRAYVKNAFQKEAKLKKQVKIEYKMQVNGHVRFISHHASLVIRQDQQIIEGTIQDITDMKLYEQEKREHDFLIRVLDNSPIGKTMVDKPGNIIFANKKAEEIFGITQEHISQRTFKDVKWEITDLKGQTIPAEKLPFSIIMETKKPLYNFRHYIKKGDTKSLLNISGSPFYDENDEVAGAVFSIQDITEDSKVEMALKESEAKYRSLFNSNRDAILVANTNREIIDANPAFEELTGYKLKELKGKKTKYIYAQNQQFDEMGQKLKKQKHDKGFLNKVVYKKKNGDTFVGETSTFPVNDEHNKLVAYVGLIRDVTDQQ